MFLGGEEGSSRTVCFNTNACNPSTNECLTVVQDCDGTEDARITYTEAFNESCPALEDRTPEDRQRCGEYLEHTIRTYYNYCIRGRGEDASYGSNELGRDVCEADTSAYLNLGGVNVDGNGRSNFPPWGAFRRIGIHGELARQLSQYDLPARRGNPARRYAPSGSDNAANPHGYAHDEVLVRRHPFPGSSTIREAIAANQLTLEGGDSVTMVEGEERPVSTSESRERRRLRMDRVREYMSEHAEQQLSEPVLQTVVKVYGQYLQNDVLPPFWCRPNGNVIEIYFSVREGGLTFEQALDQFLQSHRTRAQQAELARHFQGTHPNIQFRFMGANERPHDFQHSWGGNQGATIAQGFLSAIREELQTIRDAAAGQLIAQNWPIPASLNDAAIQAETDADAHQRLRLRRAIVDAAIEYATNHPNESRFHARFPNSEAFASSLPAFTQLPTPLRTVILERIAVVIPHPATTEQAVINRNNRYYTSVYDAVRGNSSLPPIPSAWQQGGESPAVAGGEAQAGAGGVGEGGATNATEGEEETPTTPASPPPPPLAPPAPPAPEGEEEATGGEETPAPEPAAEPTSEPEPEIAPETPGLGTEDGPETVAFTPYALPADMSAIYDARCVGGGYSRLVCSAIVREIGEAAAAYANEQDVETDAPVHITFRNTYPNVESFLTSMPSFSDLRRRWPDLFRTVSAIIERYYEVESDEREEGDEGRTEKNPGSEEERSVDIIEQVYNSIQGTNPSRPEIPDTSFGAIRAARRVRRAERREARLPAREARRARRAQNNSAILQRSTFRLNAGYLHAITPNGGATDFHLLTEEQRENYSSFSGDYNAHISGGWFAGFGYSLRLNSRLSPVHLLFECGTAVRSIVTDSVDIGGESGDESDADFPVNSSEFYQFVLSAGLGLDIPFGHGLGAALSLGAFGGVTTVFEDIFGSEGVYTELGIVDNYTTYGSGGLYTDLRLYYRSSVGIGVAILIGYRFDGGREPWYFNDQSGDDWSDPGTASLVSGWIQPFRHMFEIGLEFMVD